MGESTVQQPKMVPPKLKLDLSGLNPSSGLGGVSSNSNHSSSPAASSGSHVGTTTMKTSPTQGLGLGQGPVRTTSPKSNSSPRYLSFASTVTAINTMDHNHPQHSQHSSQNESQNNNLNNSRAGSIMSVATSASPNSRQQSILSGSSLGAIAEVGASGGGGSVTSGRIPRDEKIGGGAPMTFVPHLPSDPKPNRRSMLTPRMAQR